MTKPRTTQTPQPPSPEARASAKTQLPPPLPDLPTDQLLYDQWLDQQSPENWDLLLTKLKKLMDKKKAENSPSSPATSEPSPR
jgi:hypothetical protein